MRTIPASLQDLATVLCITPNMFSPLKHLTKIATTIHESGLFERSFLPFLQTYTWTGAERHNWATKSSSSRFDAASCWDSEHTPEQMGYNTYDIRSFAEIQAWFRAAIATETRKFTDRWRRQVAYVQWSPTRKAHADAFAYALFLWMYLQTGKATAGFTLIYWEALRQLAAFRCQRCGTDYPYGPENPTCRVCEIETAKAMIMVSTTRPEKEVEDCIVVSIP